MRAETTLFTIILVFIALTLCSCTPQEIAEVDASTKDMLVVYTTPQSESPQMINTFTQAEKTEIINPYFSLQNTTTEIFRVDHAGNFYLYPLTNCNTLDTSGTGLLSCGTDANTNCSMANSCPLIVYSTNTTWITANQGYNTTAQIFAVANNGTFLKTYTNLTEDDVEGYIFDSDNTANLDMNNYNITVNTIVMETDQANHWIYDNATCIVMKAGTTYLEVCE